VKNGALRLLALAWALSACTSFAAPTPASTSSASVAVPASASPDAPSLNPSLFPSAGPEATPQVAESLQPVAGVPEALRDRYWITESCCPWPGMDGGWASVAGNLGTDAYIVLPLDEWALGADDGLIASGIRRDTSSTIIVRDLATGTVVRTFETSVTVMPNDGALVGPRLFWTGTDAGTGRDAGVWALDLSRPDSNPAQITPGVGDLSQFGALVERTPFLVSLSGETITSRVGSRDRGPLEVIDVRTLSLRSTVADELLYAAGDNFGLAWRDKSVALISLASGREVWHLPVTPSGFGTFHGGLVGDDQAIVAFSPRRGGEVRIVGISLGSNDTRIVAVLDGGRQRLSGELSSDHLLVVLGEYSIGAAWEEAGSASVSLLDTRTGEQTPDAFQIARPY
jgi:hypothetical protein